MSKDQIISARILTLIATGMTLPEAFDAVLGAGSYMALASLLLRSDYFHYVETALVEYHEMKANRKQT